MRKHGLIDNAVKNLHADDNIFKWFLNTFKYRAKLVQAFAFQPVRLEYGVFCFECIKACLRHDLSRHVESARRNMKSKLAIKFPTPNSPPPPPCCRED